MSNVAFLNTGYQPTQDEREWWYYLQKETNNIRREILREESDKYWQVLRWDMLVNARRSKIKLVKSNQD